MSRETSQRLISPGSGVRSQSCSERTFRDCYPTGLGLQRSTCLQSKDPPLTSAGAVYTVL